MIRLRFSSFTVLGVHQRSYRMTNKSEEPEYPSWLNEELFVELLKRDIQDFKTVNRFDVKETCAKGEHFTTLVLRVKIIVDLKGIIDLVRLELSTN